MLNRLFKYFIFYVCYFYYLVLIKTVKVNLIGERVFQDLWRNKKNVVFCCPHNFLLGLFVGVDAAKMKRPIVTLIASLSSDGELISKMLEKRRYEMTRGSSSRGGQKALLQLRRAGKEGKSLGLAYDGPKGPALIPKRGVLGCARAINGSIFLAYGFARHCKYIPFLKPFRVNSWDKFLVPVPFCSLDVYFEKIPDKEDVHVESDAEYENFVLNYIEKRGMEIYGSLYVCHQR